MTDRPMHDGHDRVATDQLVARLDRMVATGRITPEEAARVRSATNEREHDAALRAIRERHARERIQTAVDAGRLPPSEAGEMLQRLRVGEDPHELRRRIVGSKHPRPSSGDRGSSGSATEDP